MNVKHSLKCIMHRKKKILYIEVNALSQGKYSITNRTKHILSVLTYLYIHISVNNFIKSTENLWKCDFNITYELYLFTHYESTQNIQFVNGTHSNFWKHNNLVCQLLSLLSITSTVLDDIRQYSYNSSDYDGKRFYAYDWKPTYFFFRWRNTF